jgi:hypothetical protein
MIILVLLTCQTRSGQKRCVQRVAAAAEALFTISTHIPMFYFRLRRSVAVAALCGLFFQGCKSGSHAVVEEAEDRETYQTGDHACDASEVLAVVSGTHAQFPHPSFAYPDAHDQPLVASSSPSEPSRLCPLFAAAPAFSVIPCSTSPVRVADVSRIQFASESFTTSSGERVSFSKQGDGWQATLQYGTGSCIYERTLPVVSSGNIETLLMHLQQQDVWASRSRIHVMATAKPPHMLCAYLGKLGLLGGGPTRLVPPPVLEDTKPAARPSASDARVGGSSLMAGGPMRPVPPPVLEDTKPAAKPNTSNARVGSASLKRTILQVSQVQEGASEQPPGFECEQDSEQVEEEQSPKRCRVEARGDGLCQTLAASSVFGEKDWQQYFGYVGSAPPLPANMNTILRSPCPFWPNKQVKDTHLLALIPTTVDGRPFTLNLLAQLAKNPKGGERSARFRHCDGSIRRELGDQSPDNSYWILMTREVLPRSLYQTCAVQDELIATCAHATGLPYTVPCALEAATVILSHYVRTGERLYASHPEKYTRCQEVVGTSKYPVMVGCFSSEGLLVICNFFLSTSHGTSCLRKL